MAIISFLSNCIEESGKSSAVASIGTALGINHNYKILILDTAYNSYFYQDCYWRKKNTDNLTNKSEKINIGTGISGLAKAILSNKVSPEIVTNYTRIVFADSRLEILTEAKLYPEEYETYKKTFKDIAKISNKYYDLVLVDIDKNMDEKTKNELLEISDIVVVCMVQKLRSINKYLNVRQRNEVLKDKIVIPLIGRYNPSSKCTRKKVTKYFKEKNKVCTIPYNIQFSDACNVGKVSDFFINHRKPNSKDVNAIFVNEVQETAEEIITRLQELQMQA